MFWNKQELRHLHHLLKAVVIADFRFVAFLHIIFAYIFRAL